MRSPGKKSILWQLVGESGIKWNAGNSGVSVINPLVELKFDMFLGEYRHSVDDKGRLTVPSRYRQLLEDGGYVTEGFDPNLLVLQKDTFEQLGQAIQRLSITDSSMREAARLWFSRAERIQPDSSGRILLPQFLRTKHDLVQEVVLVGVGSYFEIWSPEEWLKQAEKLDSAQQNAEYFSKLNLSLNQNG